VIASRGTPWQELEGDGLNALQGSAGSNVLRPSSKVQSRLAPLPASIPTPGQGFKGSKVQGMSEGAAVAGG